jgi:hypothetical protein
MGKIRIESLVLHIGVKKRCQCGLFQLNRYINGLISYIWERSLTIVDEQVVMFEFYNYEPKMINEALI